MLKYCQNITLSNDNTCLLNRETELYVELSLLKMGRNAGPFQNRRLNLNWQICCS